MKKNKCYTLLQLLTSAERKIVLQKITARKDELKTLLKLLIKAIDEDQELPHNEELIYKVYKTSATKSADDKLRSDYRHLSKIAEEVLAQKHFIQKSDYQSDAHFRYHLLMALIEREEFDLFYEEAQAALQHFLTHEDFANYVFFYHLLKEYTNRFAPTTKDNFEALYSELLTTDSFIIKNFLMQWSQHQIRKSFAVVNIKIYKPDFTPPPQLDFSDLEMNNSFPYLNYLKAKSKSYSTDVEDRKQALIDLHTLLSGINHPAINLPLEKLTIGVNLFTIYCLTHEQNKGFAIAKEVQSLIDQHQFDDKILYVFYFNLCSMKLRYEQIEEGVQLIEVHAERFYNSPYGTRFKFLKVFQHLFEGEYDKAYKAIPSDFSPSSEDKLYIKLIETIIYFMRKQYDLCINQVKNIRQNADNNSLSNPTYDYFAETMLALLNAVSQSQVAELKQKVDNYYDLQIKTTNPYLLPIVWIKQFMGKLIK